MATGKRYYWIKLKDSFMSSDMIDYLMGQPDGANYVVLYQMLCLKTINTGGRLAFQIGDMIIPYDVEKIQRECKWFSLATVRVALEVYKQIGLIYEDKDGVLVLANYSDIVGSETDYSAQKRLQRENRRRQLPPKCADSNEDNNVDNVHTEKEIEIDKEKDINTLCPEVETSEQKVFISLPLVTGSGSFDVTFDYLNSLRQLYPAIDVEQEFRKMCGWLDSNPRNRKTARGIKRFITGWLSRAQDKAPAYRPHPGGNRNIGTEQYMESTAGWND